MGLRIRLTLVGGLAIVGALVPASPSFGVTAGAVTADDRLLTFDTASPGTVTSGPRAIAGLQAGESVLGIDMRPATNQLLALGSSGRLYRLSTATAAATQIGSGFSVGLIGTRFGFDFSPTVDRTRIVSDAEQNFRANPNDGSTVDGDPGTPGIQLDTNLFYIAGDPNFGANPNIVGTAYTNNFSGASTTTVFGIDSNKDILVRQGGVDGSPSPNTGQLTTIGPLGLNTDDRVGFDIRSVPGAETAFATMATPSPTTSALYTVNLTSGAVTTVGSIGGGAAVTAFAIGVPPSLEAPPADPTPTPTDPTPTDPTPTNPTPDTTAPESLLALPAVQKLKKVLKGGGIGAELSCDEACNMSATLTGKGKSRATKIYGTGSASLAEAGVGKIDVRLNGAGRRFLQKRGDSKADKTKLSLALAVTDGSQNVTNLTRKLTLTH